MSRKPRQIKFVYYCILIRQMKSEIFTYQPTSQPNAWILLIGPDRIGSLAYDSFNRYIRHAEYTPFDLYTPTVFDQLAKEVFPARAEIRKIRAAFLLPEWCWLPSAVIGEKDAQKWLAAQWPEKPGHEWVADRNGPAEATCNARMRLHLYPRRRTIQWIEWRSFGWAIGVGFPSGNKINSITRNRITSDRPMIYCMSYPFWQRSTNFRRIKWMFNCWASGLWSQRNYLPCVRVFETYMVRKLVGRIFPAISRLIGLPPWQKFFHESDQWSLRG
jgi:hypothetical protein